MKVLVTGASGFIGRHVLLRAPRSWQIVAVCHRRTDLDAFVLEQQLANVRVVRCDLADAAAVSRLAEGDGVFDACLYLAANGDPAKSADRPAWDLQLNTLALVTCLEKIRVGHLVYVSSGAVYDGLTGAVTPAAAVAPPAHHPGHRGGAGRCDHRHLRRKQVHRAAGGEPGVPEHAARLRVLAAHALHR